MLRGSNSAPSRANPPRYASHGPSPLHARATAALDTKVSKTNESSYHGTTWRETGTSVPGSSGARAKMSSSGFWFGVALATCIWCLLGSLFMYAYQPDGSSLNSGAADFSTLGRPEGIKSALRAISDAPRLLSDSALKQQPTTLASPPAVPLASPLISVPRSDHSTRFTDMTCFTHGDEAELCKYEHALCYDGEHLVMSVPQPPGPSVGSNELGLINGDVMANCYDFRFYDTEAPDYTGCRYDSPRFHRIKAKLLSDAQLNAKPLEISSMLDQTFGNAFPTEEALEQLFVNRDLKSEWAIPLLRRRWGPLNRGQVWLRETRAAELFGSDSRDVPQPPPCDDCSSPEPIKLPPEMRVSNVTRYGNTTATWLDGALWILTVDAQFAEHIYHFSTRILSLFSAQRHNSTEFGENPADGYLLPFTKDSHPINATWDLNTPLRRRPNHRTNADFRGSPGDELHENGFIEESNAPNRVQYLTGSQFPNLPPIDYVAFVGPSATFPNVRSLLPFLQAMLKLSGQRHTHYFARDVTSKLSPNNLICSKRGAVLGTHNMFFPSRADAWYFRQSAYDFAGLTRQGIHSHDAYPPRKITIITRKRKNGRYFENQAEFLAAVNAIGLEVEVIEDLGKMPFKQVVAKMAGTGILIAAHGAALVNAMFLPQHAVVIEIFPYYMKKMTYWSLSSIIGHFYFPLYTWKQPAKTPENEDLYAWKIAENEHFVQKCLDRNVSTIDALLEHACNSVSKLLPINVDLVAFAEVLRNALDAISANSPARLELLKSQKAELTIQQTKKY